MNQKKQEPKKQENKVPLTNAPENKTEQTRLFVEIRPWSFSNLTDRKQVIS